MLHDVEMNLKSTTTNPFNNSLRCGTEQPGSSFGLIFFLFPTKIAGGNPWCPTLSDSPVPYSIAWFTQALKSPWIFHRSPWIFLKAPWIKKMFIKNMFLGRNHWKHSIDKSSWWPCTSKSVSFPAWFIFCYLKYLRNRALIKEGIAISKPPSTLKVFTSCYWGKEVLEKSLIFSQKILYEPCAGAFSVLRNDFSKGFQDLKQQYHRGIASLKLCLCLCLSVLLLALLLFFSDLSNKSHLKVLESRPFQNGPVSHPVSSPTAVHTGAQVTSTPLPNHSFVPPANAIHSGGSIKYSRTTRVTRQATGGPKITTVTRVVNNDEKENSATHTTASAQEGMSLMDKKKVPLPGLGTTLNPRRYWHIVVFYLIGITKWKYFEAAWHYLFLSIWVQCL